MKELEERKKQRACSLTQSTPVANLDLMTSLSIELQRLNSEMILQRLPRDQTLEVRDLTKLESAYHCAVDAAKKSLNSKIVEADDTTYVKEHLDSEFPANRLPTESYVTQEYKDEQANYNPKICENNPTFPDTHAELHGRREHWADVDWKEERTSLELKLTGSNNG
eukprot:TRINITY_DN4067_c0_g1_i1.p1 TRINITY_DN4067_c0_g1~~TRINITY_DN4067_c0_g1_i1.p1  ORF type:complete len:176 (+),score=16.66 TRINITY_DN4067_c0_g1_i1:31-528(+)